MSAYKDKRDKFNLVVSRSFKILDADCVEGKLVFNLDDPEVRTARLILVDYLISNN